VCGPLRSFEAGPTDWALRVNDQRSILEAHGRTYAVMDLKLESRAGLLLATAAGQVSLNELVDLGKKVCDAASERGLRRVLLDCVAVEGELSVTERFILGKTIAEYSITRSIAVKVAILGNAPTVTGLGAQVAWNRGMMVEAFSERQAAMDWLNAFGSKATGS